MKKTEEIEELFKSLENKSLNFINEAEIYQKIIKFGYTQAELGLEIGKTQPAIGNKLRLLNLPQECRSLIIAYRLTERHARAILKIKNESKMLQVIKHIIVKELTVQKTENYIRLQIESDIKHDPDGIKSFILEVNSDIQRFQRRGLKILAQKQKKEGYTDILIRVYKKEIV